MSYTHIYIFRYTKPLFSLECLLLQMINLVHPKHHRHLLSYVGVCNISSVNAIKSFVRISSFGIFPLLWFVWCHFWGTWEREKETFFVNVTNSLFQCEREIAYKKIGECERVDYWASAEHEIYESSQLCFTNFFDKQLKLNFECFSLFSVVDLIKFFEFATVTVLKPNSSFFSFAF